MKRVLVLLFLLFFSTLLFPREITIKTIDADLDIPLEGVKIQVRGLATQYTTDNKGISKIIVGEDIKNLFITATLPGYSERKYVVKENETEVILKLTIKNVIEGKELVIEKEAIGKKDEEVGVSKVIDNRVLSATAAKGPIEDVMTTIKKMPGVSYSGSFNVRLSIRGGHPDELTCFYDGFLIRFPYHWGGGFSIFNPNIIESIKFSNGIFNVKNGYAISGLIELETVTPDQGLKFDTKLASNSFEFLLQSNLSKKSGFFIGTRLLYTEIAFWISDYIKANNRVFQDGVSFPIAPYIRDGYLKWYFKPNKRFEWTIDGFFASDGINFYYNGNYDPTYNYDIKTIFNFLYYNYDLVGFSKFKILPSDRLLITFLIGHEFWYNGVNGEILEFGEKRYSNSFKLFCLSNGIPLSGDTFVIDDVSSNFVQDTLSNSTQSRLDFDFTLHEKVLISWGTGLFYDITTNPTSGKIYQVDWETGVPIYKKVRYKLDLEEKYTLKSNLYINFLFNIFPEIFKIEAGCRVDHFVIYLLEEGEKFNYNSYHFTTYPVPGPRVNVTLTPLQNTKFIEKLTFTLGFGLFCKIPENEEYLSKEVALRDFQINVPKALSTVLGTEVQFPLGFKIKVEGYYKYYYDLFYINLKSKNGKTEFLVHSDGIGHIAGFDIIAERKLSRYIDGWISYSFIFARFLKPSSDGLENPSMNNREPRGIWYYPYYHRFNTFNIVVNIKPMSWFTITSSFTFATGTPKLFYESKTMFAAFLEDGTVVEMYTRKPVYSDILRTNISFPFDLKFSFNSYISKSKVRFEAYIAFDDIFSFLTIFLPQDNVETDKYTGENRITATSSFSTAIPIPSVGVRVGF